MALSYKQFCNLWGRGFLLAAIIADIAGLLIGGGEWVGMLYLCAAVLLRKHGVLGAGRHLCSRFHLG